MSPKKNSYVGRGIMAFNERRRMREMRGGERVGSRYGESVDPSSIQFLPVILICKSLYKTKLGGLGRQGGRPTGIEKGGISPLVIVGVARII